MPDQILLPIIRAPCTRNNPPHIDVLRLFQALTPEVSDFAPIRVWPVQSSNIPSTCSWCVVYTVKHPEDMAPLQVPEDLINLLLIRRPLNATIVNREFYDGNGTNQQGWIMTWELDCHHLIPLSKCPSSSSTQSDPPEVL